MFISILMSFISFNCFSAIDEDLLEETADFHAAIAAKNVPSADIICTHSIVLKPRNVKTLPSAFFSLSLDA